MSGKRVGEYSWRYLTDPVINRVVDAGSPDADLKAATVDAVPESIDNSDSTVAYNNALGIVAILDTTVTSATISVLMDLGVKEIDGETPIAGAERWCLLSSEVITRSDVLVLRDVMPGIIKIMVTATTGSGDVKVGALLPK